MDKLFLWEKLCRIWYRHIKTVDAYISLLPVFHIRKTCIFPKVFIMHELLPFISRVCILLPKGMQSLTLWHVTAVGELDFSLMAKKPVRIVKLQLKAGQANPAPPVGTALGPTGIQIAEFCKQFNDQTKDQIGKVLPTVISIYEDRTFSFYTKQPPATWWIKDALQLQSGSKEAHKIKVGHLSLDQLRTIAEWKMPDLNAHDLDHALSIIAGSARSMGITTDLKK